MGNALIAGHWFAQSLKKMGPKQSRTCTVAALESKASVCAGSLLTFALIMQPTNHPGRPGANPGERKSTMTPFVKGYQDAINGRPADSVAWAYENRLNKHDLHTSGPTSYIDGYRQGTRELAQEKRIINRKK